MSDHRRQSSQRSRPRPVPTSSSSPQADLAKSPAASSVSRTASNTLPGSPSVRQIPTPRQLATGESSQAQTPLPGSAGPPSSLPGPGESSLTNALKNSLGASPPRFGTPPLRPLSPAAIADDEPPERQLPPAKNGSSMQGDLGRSPAPYEDLDVVRKHLVGPSHASSSQNLAAEADGTGSKRWGSGLREDATQKMSGSGSGAPKPDEKEFSSLQLQGGDITRQLYRYVEGRDSSPLRRTRSYHVSRTQAGAGSLDIDHIRQPGGFRRDHLRRTAGSPSPAGRKNSGANGTHEEVSQQSRPPPRMFTSNFIEFLSLYGQFAGEQLDEDDEELEPDEYFSSDAYDDGASGDEDHEPGEESALLTPGRRRRKRRSAASGNTSTTSAAFMLLKSFVGTGVLFLPRAFLNGGMIFSNAVLLAIAILSYWCFILLVRTRLKYELSFGDMGEALYGRWLRIMINFSLVISQIGFSSAYIVFTSENLQAFILAVSQCKTFIDIKYMILMQLVIFLPVCLYRKMGNLKVLALIADAFIAAGLIYIWYYDIHTMAVHHGVADVAFFNKNDWTLFIGTAIFTFEGIGLIIPIQSSMRDPGKFPFILAVIMVVISVLFLTTGALSYAAYGSATKTVILLNMPQDSKLVNGVQFIYSVAILLSTPLQFFPAIDISSQQLFSKTGKYNPYIKWKKNIYRFFMVFFCAFVAWIGANDLDKFVALVGSFACVPLVYIYPPLLHYRAVQQPTWRKVTDIALCIFGFIVMGYTTALTVISWTHGSSSKTPGYCDNR
ncbi:amino acid transporter-like protein [Cryomyces antarcticus]